MTAVDLVTPEEKSTPVRPDRRRGGRRGARPVKPLKVRALAPARPTVEAPAFQRTLARALGLVSAALVGLVVNLVLVSPVEHYTAQTRLFAELRLHLAEGSAPTGPLGTDGRLVEPGTPVALFSAPGVGLGRSVVVEGTAASQTMVGIGHRRDTPLPCQHGTSVLMARSGAYGAEGDAWKRLAVGDRFTVTMSQGTCTYQVTGVRSAGDPAPPAPGPGEGRLTLTTAAGAPFMPTEAYRVDASVVADAFTRPSVSFPPGSLPDSEAAMAKDPSNGFALVLLLQLLTAIGIGIVWMRRRWGRWQAWIVGTPPLLAAFGTVATVLNQLLLPNLL